MTTSRPPAPPPGGPIKQALPVTRVMSDRDSVTLGLKVTYKTNDNVFVSVDVGYTAGALPQDGNNPMKMFKRAQDTVNAMFKHRDAEVRASLGIK